MSLQQKIETLTTLLKEIESNHSTAALATSFGVEDMLLTDVINKHAKGISIFTLDTGRLPAETYELMQQTRDKYGEQVLIYAPNNESVENYVQKNGPNGFYDSIEKRKACCQVRKLEPLKRALTEREAWLTGLRREQSVTRTGVQIEEWDQTFELKKFNPLLEWSEKEVWEYVKKNNVPYNKLHDQHYPSIGCAPCTRAISAGEDIRAGRWWWENPEHKECGLHIKQAS